ncbi:hypothetical protein BASA62_010099 [Batrachochytrium salamandrivorans]|nr:hypothetical protein BASA62_010099 [Batrachochytrium salamandrivorans]
MVVRQARSSAGKTIEFAMPFWGTETGINQKVSHPRMNEIYQAFRSMDEDRVRVDYIAVNEKRSSNNSSHPSARNDARAHPQKSDDKENGKTVLATRDKWVEDEQSLRPLSWAHFSHIWRPVAVVPRRYSAPHDIERPVPVSVPVRAAIFASQQAVSQDFRSRLAHPRARLGHHFELGAPVRRTCSTCATSSTRLQALRGTPPSRTAAACPLASSEPVCDFMCGYRRPIWSAESPSTRADLRLLGAELAAATLASPPLASSRLLQSHLPLPAGIFLSPRLLFHVVLPPLVTLFFALP